MPAPAAVTADRTAPGKGIVLPRVEVFAAGVWQGDVYTIADLDDMVRNFAELYPTIEPPVKIGHDEDQEFSGVPAVGWVVRLWREGPKLFADLEQVFPEIADLIEAGAYRKVSAEIYPKDEPPEGVQADGYVFKALAFLGGELPHLKHLSELPKPVRFAEKVRRKPGKPFALRLIRSLQTTSRHKVFFEATVMDRKALEAQLAGIGWTPEMIAALASLSDDDMAAFVLLALATAAGGGTPPPAAGNADPVWPDGLDRNACIAALVDMGEDKAALDAMSDPDLIALYEQKKGAMSDTNDTSGAGGAPKTVTYKYVEGLVQQAFKAVVEPQLKTFTEQVRSEKAVRQQGEASARKALIHSFCERMVKEAKLSPADVEVDKKTGKTVGPVRARLERAPAVRTFADKPSELDLQMAEIEARPPRKFSERIADPAGGTGGKYAEARKAAEARIAARKPAPGRTLEERLRMVPHRAAV